MSFLSFASIFCFLIISLIDAFFIISASFYLLIIILFFCDWTFKLLASFIYLNYLFLFYWSIAILLYSFSYWFRINLSSSSCSRICLNWSLRILSSSFLCLTCMTCSALRLVSWIFFHAFFSSIFRRAIRFASSFASSAAFFLFCRVSLSAPVTSSGSSSSPYSP